MGSLGSLIVFCMGFVIFQQLPLLIERLILLVGIDDSLPLVCLSACLMAVGLAAIVHGLIRRHDTGIKRRAVSLIGYAIFALYISSIPLWDGDLVAGVLVISHSLGFVHQIAQWCFSFSALLPFAFFWSGLFFLAIPVVFADRYKRDARSITGRAWFAFGGVLGLYVHLFLPMVYPLVIVLRVTGGSILLVLLSFVLSRVLRKRALAFTARPTESLKDQLFDAEKESPTRILLQIVTLGFSFGALMIVWYTLSRYLVSGIAVNFWHILLCTSLGMSLGIYVYVMVARRVRISKSLALLWPLIVASSVQISYYFFVENTALTADGDARDYWFLLERLNELSFPVTFLIGIMFGMIAQRLRRDDFGPPGQRDMIAWGCVLISVALGLIVGDFFVTVLGPEETCFLVALTWAIATLFSVPRERWKRVPSLSALACLLVGIVVLSTWFYPFGVLRKQQARIARNVLQNGALSSDEASLPNLQERLPSSAVILKTTFLGDTLERHLSVDNHMVYSTGLIGQRDGRLPLLIPLALGNRPRDVLQIAPGVEMSTAMLSNLPFVRSIQIVDPLMQARSPTVRSFSSIQKRNDGKISVEQINARLFLRVSTKTYDLITIEPPSILLGKGAHYFSRDFFAHVANHLSDDGSVSLKVPIGELSEYGFQKIVAGFCDVFPNCSLWYVHPRKWLLSGGEGALTIDEAWLNELWQIPVIRDSGYIVGSEKPGLLFSNFIADAKQLRALSEGITPLKDDLWLGDNRRFRNRVDSFFLEYSSVESTSDRFVASTLMNEIVPASIYRQVLYFFQYRPLLESTLNARHSEPRPIFAFEPLSFLLEETDLLYFPLLLLHSSPEKQSIVFKHGEDESYKGIVASFRGIQELIERNYARAAALFTHAIASNSSLDFLYNYRIFSLCLATRNAGDDHYKKRKTALFISLAIAQERLPHTSFNKEFWRWAEACGEN